MKFSTAIILAASASMAAAWNVTAYTDTECSENGYSIVDTGDIGCVTTGKTANSIKVSDLAQDMVFIGSSGGGCDYFHQSGGNGCYTQSQGFLSWTVFKNT
ncbi:uncharacterized protein PFLUO_LOCUS5161 [Penicillium psychrofluorescens]|uniref:uncharacterized protein n=1 Tax=Penicillium psychrofluorescens TaxID=3158075 RepID=UPI003CCC9FE3